MQYHRKRSSKSDRETQHGVRPFHGVYNKYYLIIVFKSCCNVFSVFLFVPLQNLFDWTEHPFECVPLNRNHSAVTHAFHASLSGCVAHQCNLSKVVSFSELKHFFCLFFCNQFSIHNHVKFISFLSFLHDVVSTAILFFLQNITKLLSFIRIDFGENGNF